MIDSPGLCRELRWLALSKLIDAIKKTPQGGIFVTSEMIGNRSSHEPLLESDSLASQSAIMSDEYVELQVRIYRLTFFLTFFAVAIAGFFWGTQACLSLLIGALSGVFYLRLLARGIGKLGTTTKMVGKIQLLVPVLLVVAVSKTPQLDLLPALLGFLLYKPALIIQFLSMP